MKIKKEHRDLIIAMAIGDGHINKSGYLSIRHGLAQKDYATWKLNILKKYFKTTDLYYVDNDGHGAYEFRTKCYDFIKLYRRILYPNNKKTITRKILNKLTPLHIAIWYMDDGSMTHKKRNGEVYSSELTLNTYLSKEENEVIIKYFMEVHNVKFCLSKSYGKYRLRMGTFESVKFLDIIKKYVLEVECMHYKLCAKSKTIQYFEVGSDSETGGD